MTVQEKRSLVDLFSVCIVIGLFVWYAFFLYPERRMADTGEYSFWAIIILSMIPIQIVVNILMNIIFTIIDTIITRVEEPYMSDERDKLIETKAARNSFYIFMISVIICMIPVAMQWPLHHMFHMLVWSIFLAQVFWHASHYYFYRRGY